MRQIVRHQFMVYSKIFMNKCQKHFVNQNDCLIVMTLIKNLGFNWITAYSRPIYFSFLAIALLILDSQVPPISFHIQPHWIHFHAYSTFVFSVRDIVASIILTLPILSVFGLLPQVNYY